MSIWTDTESKYGSYKPGTKTVSNSTARRWAKESRTKHRRSRDMITCQPIVTATATVTKVAKKVHKAAQPVTDEFSSWASSGILGQMV